MITKRKVILDQDQDRWDKAWLTETISEYPPVMLEILRKYVKPGMKALDAGCGIGFSSKEMLTLGAKVTALDYSIECLKLCEQEGIIKDFVHGDIRELPFKENSFDIIFSDGAIEHSDDYVDCMSKFHRCLRKGGILILAVPAVSFVWNAYERLVPARFHKEKKFGKDKLVQISECCGFTIKDAFSWRTFSTIKKIFGRNPEAGNQDFIDWDWANRSLCVVAEK